MRVCWHKSYVFVLLSFQQVVQEDTDRRIKELGDDFFFSYTGGTSDIIIRWYFSCILPLRLKGLKRICLLFGFGDRECSG